MVMTMMHPVHYKCMCWHGFRHSKRREAGGTNLDNLEYISTIENDYNSRVAAEDDGSNYATIPALGEVNAGTTNPTYLSLVEPPKPPPTAPKPKVKPKPETPSHYEQLVLDPTAKANTGNDYEQLQVEVWLTYCQLWLRYQYYIVSQKNMSSNFCPYLRQILNDFKNSFTGTSCGKFAITRLLNISTYLKCVATLHYLVTYGVVQYVPAYGSAICLPTTHLSENSSYLAFRIKTLIIALYGDDILLLAPSVSELQRLLCTAYVSVSSNN